MELKVFYVLSVSLILSAGAVIAAKHAIFSLLLLVFCFLCGTFLLVLMECELLAFLFAIVYIGAIAILFLFAIMTLESKKNNLEKNSVKYLPIGFFFSLVLILPILIKIFKQFHRNPYKSSFHINKIQSWYDLTDSIIDIEVYGQVLYFYYILEVLVTGVILSLVLIGIVYLTNDEYSEASQNIDQHIFQQLSRDSKFFF